jgi:hypothetical protein
LQITDFRNGLIRFTRNLTVGIEIPIQCQGTDEIELIQNTFIPPPSQPALTLLFYNHAVLPQDTLATIVNNIFGGFYMRDGDSVSAYFRTGSDISHNIVLSSPGLTSAHGDNLAGISEFGTSARLLNIPDETETIGDVERNWELANTPITSPGIGEGKTTDVAADLYDRAYASPPDVGCLQSSVGTPVTPVPRSPYILSRYPAANATGVDPAVSPSAPLYPVPGQEINPASVTTSTAYVTDAANVALPAVVTLSDPVDGAQTITVNLKQTVTPAPVEGDLFPLVVYTAHLTDGIEDTEGSALSATAWSFRVAGTGGPAIGDGTGIVADSFVDDQPQIYSITSRKGPRIVVSHTEVRFPAGTALSVWEVTEDRVITGDAVASGVVSGDFSVAFSGLEVGTYYVAGPSLAGPFTLFRVFA